MAKRQSDRAAVGLAERPPARGGAVRPAERKAAHHPAAESVRPALNIKWGQVGGETMAQRFGMDEGSIALRREFIRLGEAERELLAEWAPWAQSVAPAIAKEFYDWQFEFGPTREFFENFARKKGMPLPALRAHLETAQAGYF